MKPDSVLLIDDDEVSNFIHREIIIRMNENASIHCCENGTEAMGYLRTLQRQGKNFPELILLDVNMPLMGGLEFLERFENIPEKQGKTIILMLTTAVNSNDEKRARSASNMIATFIEKPLTREMLSEVIENVL